jgi:hypothetical protein
MKTRRTRPESKKASSKSRRTAKSNGLIGALRGKLKVKGDIFSTGERWKAQS